MSILTLVVAPNPLLQQISVPVLRITPDMEQFCNDMLETMYSYDGIGLSAVQVGVLKRIIVVDIKWPKVGGPSDERYIMINPEIIENSAVQNSYNEGCLSFPNEGVEIIRPKVIRVSYLDLKGQKQILEADGLLATCIQHEIDHLNGITISTKISPLKRQLMINRLKKIKKTMKNVI